jgi:hypothetical protein
MHASSCQNCSRDMPSNSAARDSEMTSSAWASSASAPSPVVTAAGLLPLPAAPRDTRLPTAEGLSRPSCTGPLRPRRA